MTLAEMTDEIRRRVGENSGFGHTVKFDFGAVGMIFIDAQSVPNRVTNDDAPAQTTIQVRFDDFCKIADGTKSPAAAFFAGRLKVSGNVGVSWKLGSIIGVERAQRHRLDAE